MNIQSTANGTQLTIKIVGRLDTNTSPELEAYINQSVTNDNQVVIDCQGLEYVSSAGLRVLLYAKKKTNCLKLTNVCDIVMEVFEITGFSDILEIE